MKKQLYLKEIKPDKYIEQRKRLRSNKIASNDYVTMSYNNETFEIRRANVEMFLRFGYAIVEQKINDVVLYKQTVENIVQQKQIYKPVDFVNSDLNKNKPPASKTKSTYIPKRKLADIKVMVLAGWNPGKIGKAINKPTTSVEAFIKKHYDEIYIN